LIQLQKVRRLPSADSAFFTRPGSNAGLNEREALQRQMQMQQDAYQAEMAKLDGFWQQQTDTIADIDPQTADFKAMELPLARVKKIMRLEDDLKVIAHALLCKSCAALHETGCYNAIALLAVSTVTHSTFNLSALAGRRSGSCQVHDQL
jgi:hypothetical protein